MSKLIKKLLNFIKCRLGIHDVTSYSQQLDPDDKRLLSVSRKLSDDAVEGFMEMAALRCKHCSYTYKAKTKTDWNILND